MNYSYIKLYREPTNIIRYNYSFDWIYVYIYIYISLYIYIYLPPAQLTNARTLSPKTAEPKPELGTLLYGQKMEGGPRPNESQIWEYGGFLKLGYPKMDGLQWKIP